MLHRGHLLPRFSVGKLSILALLVVPGILAAMPSARATDDADLLDVLGEERTADADPGEAKKSEKVQAPDDAESKASSEEDVPFRVRFENNAVWFDRREVLPRGLVSPPDFRDRLRLIGEGLIPLTEGLSFRLNTALTARFTEQRAFDPETDFTVDLREAYLVWQHGPFAVEAGRINIRNGVATGFNPVDFFRSQDARERTNMDPTDARQNRLGVVAVRSTWLWDSGALSFTLAPEITGGSSYWHDEPVVGLHLSSTNPSNRFLVAFTQSLAEGFSPELYVLHDDGHFSFGAAASLSIGDRWLVYGEWAGGRYRNLMDEALRPFRDAGRLVPPLAAMLGPDRGRKFRNKVAVGFSYTSPSNIVTNVEYHYNQAAFDKDDWDEYFRLARLNARNPLALAQLASVPLHAALLLEPASRHSLFVRSRFNEIMEDLDVTLLAGVSLDTWSAGAQIQVDYGLNDNLVLTARGGGAFGARESEYGSRSAAFYFDFGLTWHF